MAVEPRRSSTSMLSLKAVLIFSGVVSMAVVLKLFVPVLLNFAVSGLPVMWSTLHSWLKPPYLYVVINGIIITIAASSRFYNNKLKDDDNNHDSHSQAVPIVTADAVPSEFVKLAAEIPPEFVYAAKMQEESEILPEFGYPAKMQEESEILTETLAVVYDQQSSISEAEIAVNEVDQAEYEEEESVISRSNWMPQGRLDSTDIALLENLLPAEKPLVSSRFSHRKSVKAGPEGGKALLRVSKPKRNETLENTWKMITDGRHVPLTRHLKKSDTWENHGGEITVVPQDKHVIKSETFKDRTNNPPPVMTSPPGSGKLRKEPSLSQDELNRRVEAFIQKFNEEMRLQRQESLNKYKEMINQGAY